MVIPLIGYADRLRAAPGETISFMVSSHLEDETEAVLVRLVCGDPNPNGPGYQEIEHPNTFTGRVAPLRQDVPLGSFAIVPESNPLTPRGSFTVMATIWPTTPNKGRQGILAKRDQNGAGFALLIDARGSIAFEIGGERGFTVATGARLRPRRWYRIWASYDATNQRISVGQARVAPEALVGDEGRAECPGPRTVQACPGPLTIAALAANPREGLYNGKIERPMIVEDALEPQDIERAFATDGASLSRIIAHWDFSIDIPGTRIIDVGPHKLHGDLVNLPTRAMMGARWSGRELCWLHASDEYGAIHFHDDDIYDAGWRPQFKWVVPENQPSGIYAMRLRAGGHEDYIVFVVTPPRDRATARLAFLLPTVTYQVYANFMRPGFMLLPDRAKAWAVNQYAPPDHPEYGKSAYDDHSDGSGVCHSSTRRPVLEFRPKQLYALDPKGSGLLHLCADLYVTAWLEANGISYDVITDHDLHAEGCALLSRYACVITGGHPEYHSKEMLDGIEGYISAGGNFIYAGGNGFYWRVAFHRDLPDVVEIRRGEGGIRRWAAEPGEYYHAFDGTYGGLWRRLNRPPQRLVGVGFSSQGDFSSTHYRRAPGASDPRAAWILEGIEGDILGDTGYLGGGAAGLELDRADRDLGTPENAIVIATSEGHSDAFVPVNEEMKLQVPPKDLPELVRSDITYFETHRGGRVFSVGSINFIGSLLWNGGDNSISRMMLNVVNRFTATE